MRAPDFPRIFTKESTVVFSLVVLSVSVVSFVIGCVVCLFSMFLYLAVFSFYIWLFCLPLVMVSKFVCVFYCMSFFAIFVVKMKCLSFLNFIHFHVFTLNAAQ